MEMGLSSTEVRFTLLKVKEVLLSLMIVHTWDRDLAWEVIG
jgi:hypothetical protein